MCHRLGENTLKNIKYYLYISLCLCVYTDTCMCVCIYVCIYYILHAEVTGQSRMSFFRYHQPCFFKQGFWLELIGLSSLTGQSVPEIHLSLTPHCQNYSTTPCLVLFFVFLTWVLGLELGSHTCSVSPLLLELSVQPQCKYFYDTSACGT